ncbi:Oidioi.mRNA.OKI2018_I69.chr1.g2854.t1.cds [Oikopleura dioica]|uniref:Oidioi.mRNA.OKI2018_I69.chr1.g2854.t1.cds n=1 Tax=Oikopleura dioica TaxID=34765 RepID=A0ABN7SYT2_OIKDI|nr:Oidioi.mRNA.OKI2018_I69.chr1.g2854.t1.cds [Oikopleura dioica]
MGNYFSTEPDPAPTNVGPGRKTLIGGLATRLAGGHQNEEEKMEELKNTFDYFDKDGSGEISIDEVRCALNAFGFFPSEAFLQECLEKFDLDNNCLIDFDEFKFMYATLMNDTPKTVAAELCEVFNTLEVIDKRKANTVGYHGMGNDEDGFIPDRENPLYFSNYHPTGTVAVEDVVRMLTMTGTNLDESEECSAISEQEARTFLSLFDKDESGRVKTSHLVGYLTESH